MLLLFEGSMAFRLKVTSLWGPRVSHVLPIMPPEKPVGWMESAFEHMLHKSTIKGYGSDSNYGKPTGKD